MQCTRSSSHQEQLLVMRSPLFVSNHYKSKLKLLFAIFSFYAPVEGKVEHNTKALHGMENLHHFVTVDKIDFYLPLPPWRRCQRGIGQNNEQKGSYKDLNLQKKGSKWL